MINETHEKRRHLTTLSISEVFGTSLEREIDEMAQDTVQTMAPTVGSGEFYVWRGVWSQAAGFVLVHFAGDWLASVAVKMSSHLTKSTTKRYKFCTSMSFSKTTLR
jgi:hypothetical protein